MNAKRKIITVFEHDALKKGSGDSNLTERQLKALQGFYGEKGVPYYNLIHNGVQFKEYVGVIQVDNMVIEVLPKADRVRNKNKWQRILIGMLKAVNAFNVQAPSSSSLSVKPNFILDIYFEMFIREVEYLFKKGLIKKYRKSEGNLAVMKGNLVFNKQLQKNLVHKERFYVNYTNYDKEHLLHQVIRKTLMLLKLINSNTALQSRIGNLLLNFPEQKDIMVSESTFDKIRFNRKTEDYRNAVEISKLLLLNFHPDISNGRHHVLALMFDMNLLWEKFIYVSLQKYSKEKMKITAQTSKPFWKPESGYKTNIRPDIFIVYDGKNYVIDTKWKVIGNNNPSPDDLRQLYVYHEYYQAEKVALVYPGQDYITSGNYYNGNSLSSMECSVIKIETIDTITEWQKHIAI